MLCLLLSLEQAAMHEFCKFTAKVSSFISSISFKLLFNCLTCWQARMKILGEAVLYQRGWTSLEWSYLHFCFHTYPIYCNGWLWCITILQVGQVLFSSKYFTRQLLQTSNKDIHNWKGIKAAYKSSIIKVYFSTVTEMHITEIYMKFIFLHHMCMMSNLAEYSFQYLSLMFLIQRRDALE